LNQDFRELLQLFAEHNVEYMIVGGYAVTHHAQPRYTKDLDLWIHPSEENAERLGRVFARFGMPLVEVTLDDFASEGLQFMIGIEPNAVDFLTTLPGLAFPAAWKHRIVDESFGFPVIFLGLSDLIQAKITSGRPLDLADVEELRRANGRKQEP
jgi:hypothetical protein